MGFFSWKTQDTNRSIANSYSKCDTFPVIMTDDKGNKWHEDNYEGYGIFGGKDFYELLDEMNGGEGNRSNGISLDCGDKKEQVGTIYPSLSVDGKYYDGKNPEHCEAQGFFY